MGELDSLCALGRGGSVQWVAGERGIFTVAEERLAPLSGVRHIAQFPSKGPPSDPPTTVSVECSGLVVDRAGVAWTVDHHSLAAYVGPEGRAGDFEWYRPRLVVAYALPALAADSREGVWVYCASRDSPSGGLLHLRLSGENADVRIGPAPDTPEVVDVPPLGHPHLAVADNGHVFAAGQTLAGDLLVELRDGSVRSRAIAPAVSQGRHVTAAATDQSGALYVATDGAGVLTYRDGEWGVHDMTQHLPVLEGSDLKPVDDILVTNDGTVYAACQFQVVIWRPDDPQ